MSSVMSAAIERNPAWVQLLGLCPLLAVSTSIAHALALALARAFVVIGSNVTVAALRHLIPDFARLPLFVLIIATFTTVTTQLLEAFAFDIYLKIALFVQIIVTNCMILGRIEAFASRSPIWPTFKDAVGTALGFALALLALGSVREVLGQGTLLAGVAPLLGLDASLTITLTSEPIFPMAQYPPGAFIIAGLLFALLIRPEDSVKTTTTQAEPQSKTYER